MLANILIVVGVLVLLVGFVGFLLEMRRSWRARKARRQQAALQFQAPGPDDQSVTKSE